MEPRYSLILFCFLMLFSFEFLILAAFVNVAKIFCDNSKQGSIDSLLQHTVKHMLFLQSITKHNDNLNKFADSNMEVRFRDVFIFQPFGLWFIKKSVVFIFMIFELDGLCT